MFDTAQDTDLHPFKLEGRRVNLPLRPITIEGTVRRKAIAAINDLYVLLGHAKAPETVEARARDALKALRKAVQA